MKNLFKFLTFIFILFIFSNCNREEIDGFLTIKMKHTFNGDPLIIGNELIYSDSARGEYSIQKLEYLLDGKYIMGGTKYIDAGNTETFLLDHSLVFCCGGTGVSFHSSGFRFGISNDYNINNAYATENFHEKMSRPEEEGGGYYYMILEGKYRPFSSSIIYPFSIKTRPVDSIDYSFFNYFPQICGEGNWLEVENENPNGIITFNMEIMNWFQNPHTLNLESLIIEDVETQRQIMWNGIEDVFSVSVNHCKH